MEYISSSLMHLVQRLEHSGTALEASVVCDAIAECIKDISRFQRPKQYWVDNYTFQGLHSAIANALEDNSRLSLEGLRSSIVFAAAALKAALARKGSIVHSEGDRSWCSYQLAEPTGDRFAAEAREVSRLDCVELVSAAFFGFINRTQWGSRDMPWFAFDALWEFDCHEWHMKNYVLLSVLLYFHVSNTTTYASLLSEKLTITRKAIGPRLEVPRDSVLSPLQIVDDGISISDFSGEQYLLADFANEYLGGAVLRGGGTQEECMFIEYTELLAIRYLTEKMLEFEAVEISNLKRFVEHNI